MTEDTSNNNELASGLARAQRKLAALTEAGIAVRKISIISSEPAFMLGFDDAPAAAGHGQRRR